MPKGHPRNGVYNKPPVRGSKFPERDAEIIRRWNLGESGDTIGLAMNISRNTVLGAVSRARFRGEFARANNEPRKPRRKNGDSVAGLTRKEKAIVANENKEPAKPTLPALIRGVPPPIVVAKLPEVAPKDRWVGILDTKDKHCRYSEDGKLFCNDHGFPYCPEHKKQLGAFMPPKISSGRYPY